MRQRRTHLRRLLIAAPHARRLVEAAIRPHDLGDLGVAEAAPAAAKGRAATSLVLGQRKAEMVLRAPTSERE